MILQSYIGVYGNVFCLDKSTRSPSFKVRFVAEQKSLNFCTSGGSGTGAKDSEGVQSIGPRMGLTNVIQWIFFIKQNYILKSKPH